MKCLYKLCPHKRNQKKKNLTVLLFTMIGLINAFHFPFYKYKLLIPNSIPSLPNRYITTMFRKQQNQNSKRIIFHQVSKKIAFHSSTTLSLNRFLFDMSEIELSNNEKEGIIEASVTLPKTDYRTVHAAKILNLHNGDPIRVGIVGEYIESEEERNKIQKSTLSILTANIQNESNDIQNISNIHLGGLISNSAIISWIPEGKIKKPQPTKTGEPPGSLHIKLSDLSYPQTQQQNNHNLTPTFPYDYSICLLLALPRPLQLSRILPMIAQMGVDHIILSNAQKVPKDYFGSHLFRKPHQLKRHLIEGLCQAGDVRLPKLTVVKQLKPFLEDQLDILFPQYTKIIAHPLRTNTESSVPVRMQDIDFSTTNTNKPKLLIAIGPEGGWAEDYELDLFRNHGFQQITLGTRILRSDVAVVSLLTLAHDLCVQTATRIE